MLRRRCLWGLLPLLWVLLLHMGAVTLLRVLLLPLGAVTLLREVRLPLWPKPLSRILRGIGLPVLTRLILVACDNPNDQYDRQNQHYQDDQCFRDSNKQGNHRRFLSRVDEAQPTGLFRGPIWRGGKRGA